MNLKQPGFIFTELADHLLKTKKEHKNSKKQEIQDVFMKTN